MAVDIRADPEDQAPPGERCCEPVVYPDVERGQALRMATVAKALGDPVRVQLVDVLRNFVNPDALKELSGWLS